MSHTEAISCKLPLLDGENTTRARLIEIELGLENVERLQDFNKKDPTPFNDLLCIAWGLLLRCYTGQDDISFHFRQNIVGDLVPNPAIPLINQSTFRMVFHEHESLSTCFAKAKVGYAENECGAPSLVPTVSDSSSYSAATHQNTHISVQDSTRKVAQDVVVVQKVL